MIGNIVIANSYQHIFQLKDISINDHDSEATIEEFISLFPHHINKTKKFHLNKARSVYI